MYLMFSTQLSVDGYIYNGILLSHKKNGLMPFAAMWMDTETE